jgi:CRP/FNR family cyclic AMP-dependent transcriptional regulator
MTDVGNELRDFLAKTPFFGGLEQAAIDRLIRMMAPRPFEKGQAVFKEGDRGRSMYVVREGQLVACQGRGAAVVKLRRFRPGDFFGEMTLIEIQPRPYSAITETPALLYELTSANLYALYQEDLKAYVLVLQNINRELCRRLRSADARLTALAADAGDEATQIGSSRG